MIGFLFSRIALFEVFYWETSIDFLRMMEQIRKNEIITTMPKFHIVLHRMLAQANMQGAMGVADQMLQPKGSNSHKPGCRNSPKPRCN